MWNAEGISERLLEGWESGKTEDGMPFYTNHKTRKTQWDHPLLVKTMEELVDMDTIKYAAYRTAMKLRFLQKRLQLDLVELPNLTSVFDRHGFGMHCNQYIHCDELHKIVCDIFKEANRQNTSGGGKSHLGCLVFWETCRKIQMHICDRTQHVTRKAMGSLLKDLIQIPDLMNESGSFGGLNIAPAVDNCFGTSWSSHGITEDELLTWLLREPQTVVWLPTMHRMAAAEGVKHDAKCSICKALPIIGFRYRCLKCFNYDLCQMCFFTGRTSKNHKTKHPTQEYCLTTSTKEDTKALLRTVRNNFSRKHRNKRKLRYLPIDGTQQPYDPEEFEEELSDTTPEESPEIEKKVSRPSSRALKAEIERDEVDHHIINDWNMHEPDRLYQPPQNELNSIIYHLEDENRELMHEIERLHLSSPPSHSEAGSSHSSEADWLRDERDRLAAKQEVLESHNKQLELQLKRLRAIVKSGVHVPTARQPLSNISQNVPSHIPTSYPSNSQKSSTPHQQTYQLQPQSNHDNSQLTPDRLQSQDVTLSHTPASQHHESQLQFDTPESLRIDDLTMGSLEDTLGQTHFSLPDPDHTVNYPEEEAKLSELMAKLDKAYPLDTSLAATPGGNSAMEEMFRAANQIGDAFAEFVKPGALNDESAA